MWRRLTSLLALVGALAVTGVGGPALAQAAYKIQPGDTLQLEVIEDPSLNRNLLVLPDGTVSVPTGGTIQVAGHTVPEVQTSIVHALTPGFASPPTVSLAVGQLAPRTQTSGTGRTIDVYAMGEVGKPGLVAVTPGTTLLQLLAQAGGFSNFAATRRIQLHRVDTAGRETVYLFNYDAVTAGGGPAVFLQKGDVVVVPQRHLFE